MNRSLWISILILAICVFAALSTEYTLTAFAFGLIGGRWLEHIVYELTPEEDE